MHSDLWQFLISQSRLELRKILIQISMNLKFYGRGEGGGFKQEDFVFQGGIAKVG